MNPGRINTLIKELIDFELILNHLCNSELDKDSNQSILQLAAVFHICCDRFCKKIEACFSDFTN